MQKHGYIRVRKKIVGKKGKMTLNKTSNLQETNSDQETGK